MPLSLVNQVAGCWTAVDGRLAVHVFEGHVSLTDMDTLQAFGDRWVRDNTGKRAELVIIFPSRTVMSNEERRRMGELIKRWEKDRIASATVILAEGLLGAMQRSMLTGIQLIAPPQHPQKIFGAVDKAVSWLLPYVRDVNGKDITEDTVRASIDQLCRDFASRTLR